MGKGNTGKTKRRFPWELVLAVPSSLAALLVVMPAVLGWFQPSLKATANSGAWKVPCEVAKELNGIVEVSHLCEDLKVVVDPIVDTAFVNAKGLLQRIMAEVDALKPYEANSVGSLRTMYTIEIENNGDTESNRIILEITDAMYVRA